ncbi:MAG: DNA polymerase III subunit gamma/tau [Lachnospiraceae bacterium]|nr:DNA polymerase III subunit gamma/tau [Lachnospiraceae bacterium]
MSYTALYRKFRPDTFDEVKGQVPVVTTLRNQVKASRMSHAYLFCGTHGTGKTSVAKILAKAVNCESPADGNPCGECAMCQSIAAGTSMNVIEIDAASNNGVDNIREIVEEVRYSPTEGRYKVYIIDEVHMLSPGAFNALLKTLEEPPAYVIFILATTEAHKLPVTILSRCQRYDFSRITVEEITERLADLIQREGVTAEEKALRYIARASDGAMRDALSLLDRCIAFYPGETLTYDNVLEILGTVDTEVFGRLLRFVRTGDAGGAMRVLDETVMRGRDLAQFIVDFTWYLRNLLLAKSVEAPEEFLDIATEQMGEFLAEAEENEPETLVRYINVCSDLTNRIRYAGAKRVMIEVTFIRLCRPETETDYSALLDRVRHLEEQLANGVVVQQSAKEAPPAAQERKESEPKQEETAALPQALGEEIRAVAEKWSSIVSAASNPLKIYLQTARPSVDESGTKLLLVYRDEFDKSAMEQTAHLESLQGLIAKQTGKRVEIMPELAAKGRGNIAAYPDLSKLKEKVEIEYVD